MPIMREGFSIDFELLSEEQAQLNHYQSLHKLASRGGLSACEAVAIMERRKWAPMDQAAALAKLRAAMKPVPPAPIDMVLYCPCCGLQHIDAPGMLEQPPHRDGPRESCVGTWNNPPHRSHLCHGCGLIWRPADVPTNGVQAIKTRGKADTWPEPKEETL
ncbi:MAG: hypothetical protein EOO54_03730 [Haliea sp.]|nr:MAG: hypothetical protein EOO54_03730 [Haliea sp.]